MAFYGVNGGSAEYSTHNFIDAAHMPVDYAVVRVYFEAPTAVLPTGETFARVYREMPSGVGPLESCQHTGAGAPLGRPSWGLLWPQVVR